MADLPFNNNNNNNNNKLLVLGVHTSLIPWIICFLSNRRQRVKLAGSISHRLPINAGVPQGTKLGTILFLVMINNLSISDPESCTWKNVDDVSLSEGLVRNSSSTIQTSLNTVASWSSSNWMKLNAKKWKEMRICFLNPLTYLFLWAFLRFLASYHWYWQNKNKIEAYKTIYRF